MLSNELKSKINKLWDKFWSRGITNPITAIEQISYLLLPFNYIKFKVKL